MRKVHYLLSILILAMGHSVAGQDSARNDSKPSARAILTLKSVELADTYKIQVPDNLIGGRASDKVSMYPAYVFHAYPRYIDINVMVLPYSFAEGYGLVPINEEAGLFKLPFSINGSNPLTACFKMPGGGYAYYGWSTGDTAYDCTMNSPCPHRTDRSSRYHTQYTFVVFDKGSDSIIEFTGLYVGASKRVKGFHGDGRLLREVIVPSLSPIRQNH